MSRSAAKGAKHQVHTAERMRAQPAGRRRSVSNQVFPRSAGQPLPPAVRAAMESRLGANFADVRVHTDSQAQDSAEGIEARAYTVGRDIVFNRAEYSPDTQRGKKLLAHELAHVVQQSRGGKSLEGTHRAAMERSATRASSGLAPGGVEGASTPGVALVSKVKPLPPIPRPPEPGKVMPGQSPFNFVSEGPQLGNFKESVRGVLGREFGTEFKTFEEAHAKYLEHLASLSPEDRIDFAKRMRNRSRKAFYRAEGGAKGAKPSFDYTPEQLDRLRKRGASHDPNVQLEHLEPIVGDPLHPNPAFRVDHPERALDPDNIYYTQGSEGGTAKKGTLHNKKNAAFGKKSVGKKNARSKPNAKKPKAPAKKAAAPKSTGGKKGGSGGSKSRAKKSGGGKRGGGSKTPKKPAKPASQRGPRAASSKGPKVPQPQKPSAPIEPVKSAPAPTPQTPDAPHTAKPAPAHQSPASGGEPAAKPQAPTGEPKAVPQSPGGEPHVAKPADPHPTPAAKPTPPAPKTDVHTPAGKVQVKGKGAAPHLPGDIHVPFVPGGAPHIPGGTPHFPGKVPGGGKPGKFGKFAAPAVAVGLGIYGTVSDIKDGQKVPEAVLGNTAQTAVGLTGIGGGPDAAINLINLGVQLSDAPREVKEGSGMLADVTPSTFGGNAAKQFVRGTYNLATGNDKALKNQVEEMQSGKAGTPLQGYALWADIIPDLASGKDSLEVFNKAASKINNKTLEKAGNFLGDEAYQFVNKDLPEFAEFAGKDLAAAKDKIKGAGSAAKKSLTDAWNWATR